MHPRKFECFSSFHNVGRTGRLNTQLRAPLDFIMIGKFFKLLNNNNK